MKFAYTIVFADVVVARNIFVMHTWRKVLFWYYRSGSNLMHYLLAIDGGGTSCRAAIAAPDGTVLGRAVTGSANIMSNPAIAAENIVQAARDALSDAKMDDAAPKCLHAFLGLAGANVTANADAFVARLPFRETHIVDDGIIALQGALGAADGLVAILGTGSAYLGRKGDRILRAGGWGFMVGDLGSGARLGRALLQDTLLAYDHILPRSELTREVLRKFDDDPARLVAFAQDEKPRGFASFAPMVFEYADKGDSMGLSLVGGATAHVNSALQAVTWPGCERLCLLGGLAPLYANRIDPKFRIILTPPRADALAGAVELGLRTFKLSENAA
jgi:glucosamine kinase